jgi:hypothetical protein
LNGLANEFYPGGAISSLKEHHAHQLQRPRILRFDGQDVSIYCLCLGESAELVML